MLLSRWQSDILQSIDSNEPVMPQLGQVFLKQPAGVRQFINAIINDQPVSPSFQDGLKAQKVIAAAMEADQRACWVSVK